jgi:hypothetical protein
MKVVLAAASSKEGGVSEHQQLVRYDAMCRAIDAAHKVDEVKDIRDKASALEHYARQAQNTDAERRAAEIRLRAERKAGQLLAAMPKAKGGGEEGVGRGGAKNGVARDDSIKTLSDLGISRDQSSQWQKLGALPQRQFDLAIGESVKPPTTKGILRAAEPPSRKPTVGADALWLWGRLLDFERDGLLEKSPNDVMTTMTAPMKDDVHRLAPKVSVWLKRIGAMQ